MNGPEADEALFRVLINATGQHSLWPAFRDVPAGWEFVCGAARRSDCLDWIEARHRGTPTTN